MNITRNDSIVSLLHAKSSLFVLVLVLLFILPLVLVLVLLVVLLLIIVRKLGSARRTAA
jgi:hypothetical protein